MATKQFRKHKKGWDPKLIARLDETTPTQMEVSAQHVSVLIHEEKCPHGDDTYKILGIFNSTLLANQMALDFFKSKYEEYLESGEDDDGSGFYEFANDSDSSLGDENMVGWSVSSAGELWLQAVDEGDGDVYKVYVRRQAIHSSYQPGIVSSR